MRAGGDVVVVVAAVVVVDVVVVGFVVVGVVVVIGVVVDGIVLVGACQVRFFCLQTVSLSTSSSNKAFSISIRISLLASSGALLLTLVSGSGQPSARSSSCTIFTLFLYRASALSASGLWRET